MTDSKMTTNDENEVRRVLKRAFPPVDTELRRDLWPAVLRGLDRQPTRVPWYDWALIAVSAGLIAAFPQSILVFVYHL